MSARMRWSRAAALAGAAGLGCGQAMADQFDTLNVTVNSSVTNDSNVLRQPQPTADTMKSLATGVHFSKYYSLQQFQADFTETQRRFAKLHERNANTTDYVAAWNWYFTPRIGGILKTEQIQALVEGDESQGKLRNVRTTRTQTFTADAWMFGGWHLLLGANERQQRTEAGTPLFPDFRRTEEQLGVSYEAPSGTTITVTQYARQGEYILSESALANLLDNRWYERESEAKVSIKPGGHSVLTAKLSWLERRHEHTHARDFSGLTGRLDYSLTLTGKLRVDFGARRSITPTTDTLSSYRVENGTTLAPNYQISDKTSLNLRLDYAVISYLGPVVQPTGPLRRDVPRSVSLAGSWEISRNATLSARLQRLRRQSNDPRFQYDANVSFIELRLSF